MLIFAGVAFPGCGRVDEVGVDGGLDAREAFETLGGVGRFVRVCVGSGRGLRRG